MRLNKILFLLIASILFALAGAAANPPQPISIVTQTVLPPSTSASIPAALPTHLKADPIPSWVTEFAEPIIEAVAGRRPDFQDDFSKNRGWFNVVSGIDHPLYAEIYNGTLFLKLPERTKDSIFHNSSINRRNFVLTLELRFDHNQPDDTVRFQFDQSPDQRVTFDLSNNRNWMFQWGSQNNLQSMSGIYEHFPPERVPVTIIVQGAQCAVYLNDDPLTYVSNCRTSSTPQSHIWVASFRLLGDTALAVTVNFDNLKLWDLDKISNLP